MNYKQLRDLVFPLHRYIGLVVGLILVVIGLTGSLLVFYPEMNEFMVHQQVGQIAPQGEPLSLEIILDKVKATYADQADVKIDRISPSAYHHQYSQTISPVEVEVEGKNETWTNVYINPYTGDILSQRQWDGSFFDRLFQLHYQLLAGDIGLYFVGIIGLLATLLCVTGIILWPGWRKLITGFKIKWNAHAKRRHFDIHKVAGIITAVFLTLAVFTGFCWNFWDWSEPVIHAATLSPKPVEPVSQVTPGKLPVGLMKVLQTADAALPKGETITAVLPTAPNGVFEVRKKLPQDANYWGEHRVYIDQYSGEVLRVDTTQTNSLGTKVTNSFATLHYGTFWGLPSRILYVFVGLAPTVLMFTGFVMWHHRYRGNAQIKREIRTHPKLRRMLSMQGTPTARQAGSSKNL
jgi:uncharacterized iron-regulated membrane protein